MYCHGSCPECLRGYFVIVVRSPTGYSNRFSCVLVPLGIRSNWNTNWFDHLAVFNIRYLQNCKIVICLALFVIRMLINFENFLFKYSHTVGFSDANNQTERKKSRFQSKHIWFNCIASCTHFGSGKKCFYYKNDYWPFYAYLPICKLTKNTGIVEAIKSLFTPCHVLWLALTLDNDHYLHLNCS